MRNWLVGAFLSAVVCAAPAFAADQIFEKTIPLAATGTLHLENLNGSVEVRGWDRNEVEIRAVKTARQSPADLSDVVIDVGATPGRVNIATRYPQDRSVDVTVEYHVRVPYRALLERVATVNGNVGVTGMETSGELHTVNGNIEAYNCAGSLSARTTNGSIHEEMVQLGEDGMTLETVNGTVTLGLPANIGADLDVLSMNGFTTSEIPFAIKSSAKRGAMTGKIGRGGPLLHMRAVNGSVEVEALKPTA